MNYALKPRLRYIDAMRGLAIFLVVFSHVTNAYVKMPITNASFAGIYYMMTIILVSPPGYAIRSAKLIYFFDMGNFL